MVFEPRYLNTCSILKVPPKRKLLFETRINLYWALIMCWDSLMPFTILTQWSKYCYCYFIEEGNVDIERISCPKSQSQEIPVFLGRRLRAQAQVVIPFSFVCGVPLGPMYSYALLDNWALTLPFCSLLWRGVSSKLVSAPHRPLPAWSTVLSEKVRHILFSRLGNHSLLDTAQDAPSILENGQGIRKERPWFPDIAGAERGRAGKPPSASSITRTHFSLWTEELKRQSHACAGCVPPKRGRQGRLFWLFWLRNASCSCNSRETFKRRPLSALAQIATPAHRLPALRLCTARGLRGKRD